MKRSGRNSRRTERPARQTAVSRSFSHRAAHFIAFGFGAGAGPLAPGTFGTLMGIPIYLALSGLAPGLYLAAVVALFVIGVGVCRVTEHDLGTHDHGGIVWDEIVGFQLAMFLAPPGWAWVILGFLLFRLFDIWKLFPIRTLEYRIRGGFGTMLDDVLAGVYALVGLQVISYFYG